MKRKLLRRARNGLVAVTALAMLATVAAAPASQAKTTKKKAVTTKKKAVTTKKKAATTKKKAATTQKTVTTAAPAVDQGQPKNITGQEIPPGQPIKIGVMGLVGAEEFHGQLADMYEIAFDTLRKKGMIPVNGRDIVLYFRGVNALSADPATAQRAACTALAQDDKVFATVAYVNSGECLAADNKIVTITGSGTAQQIERSWPYLFVQGGSIDRGLRNAAPWAESLGLLKGRKLGLYHGTAAGRQKQIDDFFKPGLKKLGYSIAEELTTGATSTTSDAAADRIAVQRFKASGVDTIFMMGAQPGDFARAAQAQGYKPKYIYAGVESPFVCGGCPARLNTPGDLVNGSYALAGGRFMEDGQPGNPPPAAEGVACASNYEKLSGIRVRQVGTPGEQNRYQSVQWTCDQALTLVTALKAAGPKLTQGALINALETSIKKQKSGFIADITFTRTNHFGSNDIRTLQLDGSCLCWKAVGGLREPFVE